MKLHELKPASGARKARKRVGRGPGSGRGNVGALWSAPVPVGRMWGSVIGTSSGGAGWASSAPAWRVQADPGWLPAGTAIMEHQTKGISHGWIERTEIGWRRCGG